LSNDIAIKVMVAGVLVAQSIFLHSEIGFRPSDKHLVVLALD